MKTEFDFGYELEIYEKGNYGTVKRKYFANILDLVTFTNKNARKYKYWNNNYCIDVINKTKYTTAYKGCIHKFNEKIGKALLEFDLNNY